MESEVGTIYGNQVSLQEINQYNIAQNISKPFEDTNNKVTLPFVIVAMDEIEASELFDETIFPSESEKKLRFQKLRSGIKEKQLRNSYKKERDVWNPFCSEKDNIKKLIEEIVDYYNYLCTTGGFSQLHYTHPYAYDSDMPLVDPVFSSQEFFDIQNHPNAVKKVLSCDACIMVVDPISLYHPRVKKWLEKSQLTSKREISMIILMPFYFGNQEVILLIEEKLKELLFIDSRMYEYFDPLCEFCMGSIQSFQRCLYLILPIMAKKLISRIPNHNSLKTLEQYMGERGVSKGVNIARVPELFSAR
ncbi:MAG: hypothetical protein GY749_16285 [Desulfobacteraceae bacterium]|nr:hypothetical protein [Desulfobacteraceae bacterium]